MINTLSIIAALLTVSIWNVIFLNAFAPHNLRRNPLMKSKMMMQVSLSDQLSQLNYDAAFIGKGTSTFSWASLTQTASAVSSKASQTVASTLEQTSISSDSFSKVQLPHLSSISRLLTFPATNIGFLKLNFIPFSEVSNVIITTILDYERLADAALSSSAFLGPAWSSLKQSIGPLVSSMLHPDVPPSITILVTSYVTYSLVNAMLTLRQEPPPNNPYPMNKYDPISARKYFDGKWNLVLDRALQVALLSGTFLVSLAFDAIRGKLEINSEQRASELSKLLAKLGPSFIKIGQSLSIRTDLLSPAYARGLKSLQDQVPPFSTLQAKKIIENELGCGLDEVFVDFPKEPIAAASLGQVYRATIRGSFDKLNDAGDKGETDVAVKVQRPDIMNQIALDMHLIREIAPFIKRTFNLNTDLVGVIDTWGVGFVDELDYIEEAVNAKTFMDSIEQTPLAGVVFSPAVIDELTTRKVLTTQWVVGERLDKSAKEDVSVLCSIAMNTYLTMMLETGVLHCDPHPGNLLRTTEGKLCILDWGMVTRLDRGLQLTLIEHMAHLTSADYEEVPKDLLLLGFIPEGKADLIKDSGVVETLAEIYGAWTKGGGAAAINVNQVVADLQDLTAEKGNLFQIPPYFAYIAKSFSVLEGIGLTNEPNYSIIQECLPYVSKRLLTDKSERTGGALSTFIFGRNKSNQDRIIDYDRVEQLLSGFGDYTTTSSLGGSGKNSSKTEVIEYVATQVLDLLATEEETPLQRIFIEQLAKIISATTRSVWSQLRERSGTLPSGRTVLGALVDPLGIFRTSPVVRANALDERTVETTRNLLKLLTISDSSTLNLSALSNAEIIEISSVIVRKLWERRNGVLKTSNRVFVQLLQLTADRLDRGEREILVLPSSVEDHYQNDGRIREEKEEKRVESDRLESARRILATVEQ